MTTPAQNIFESESTAQNYKSWPAFDPNHWSVNTSPRFTAAIINRRPRSVSSPVRADGSRAPQVWWHSFGDFRSTPSSFEIKDAGRQKGWVYQGTCCSGFSTSTAEAVLPWMAGKSPFPVGVDAQARTKFLQKLSGNKAQLGAALGELRTTARGVTSLAADSVGMIDRLARKYRMSKRAIVNEIRNFGKSRPQGNNTSPSRWKQRGEEIRGRWLEYQMGVKPLVNDIHDAGQALSDSLFKERREFNATIRAGASDVHRTTVSTGVSPPFECLLTFDVVSEEHISAVYRVPVSATRSINELGLGNPASVAWELTQFSWMVDYLLGVGGWLESMTADNGTQFLEGSISKIQRAEPAIVQYVLSRPGENVWGKRPDFKFRGRFGYFQRDVLSGRVLPSVVPALRNRVGLTQMANVLSVLSQITGKSR